MNSFKPASSQSPFERIEPTQSSYRWVILALVCLPYAAFGLISRSIAPLVTPIVSDLHMSYSEMGLVLGSWQLTFIIFGILAGTITDRFGVRRAVFAGTIIMSISASLRFFLCYSRLLCSGRARRS
jgi:MFS transporter, CP family, cyanate transporter